jgi:predicted nucleic acid-binding protein
MKRYILDTNLLVRFLRNDHPTMSSAAAELFLQSASGKVELHLEPTIVAETAFVLTSFYKQGHAEVADAIRDLITGCRLKVPLEEVTLDALERFKAQPVDFPDALVAAIAAHQGVPVASFDRDFDRFKDVKRFEPSGASLP